MRRHPRTGFGKTSGLNGAAWIFDWQPVGQPLELTRELKPNSRAFKTFKLRRKSPAMSLIPPLPGKAKS